jgi:titin
LISGNQVDGIFLSFSNGDFVQGNRIGTDTTGTIALPNKANGIEDDRGYSNIIGGTASGAGNVISGNSGSGILLIPDTDDYFPTGEVIQGNLIGTDVTGTMALGNSTGVMVSGKSNLVGGTVAGARNVVSGNKNSGIIIAGSNNLVQGNYIGTDLTGAKAVGNQTGVSITGSNDTIGGTVTGARNVISGNQADGINVNGSGTVIRGNYIGTDVTGTKSLLNSNGVKILAAGVSVGGTEAGAGNLISGNGNGILVQAVGAVIQGNYIGTDLSGTHALANAQGIWIWTGGDTLAQIGGTTPGSRNVISGNDNMGIYILNGSRNTIQGNYIGTDVTGTIALLNSGGVDIGESADNLIGGTTPGAGNVIITRGGYSCLELSTTQRNRIKGNKLGTDATGTHVFGNLYGVFISTNSTDNVIGGTEPGAGNLISGSSVAAIASFDTSDRTSIQGNLIGTDVYGTIALGNWIGLIIASHNNLIGGSEPAAGNLISGNTVDGLELGTSNNMVEGNRIGTDLTGTHSLPNGGSGVLVQVYDNIIGGTDPGAGNLISGNKGDGIQLNNSAFNIVIQGNLIGTDITGTLALGNATGVHIAYGPNNLIGGTTAAARNVISGNLGAGVFIETSGNLAQGNFIGTDISGTIAVPNQNGMIVTASANTIGGTSPGAGNVIAGNGSNGLLIAGPTTTANLVQGNFIGTDPSMTFELGNGGNGVVMEGGFNNTIGGTTSAAGNTIAFNGQNGVLIDTGTGNAIRRNVIIGHDSGLGIELFNGGNNDQAFPILTSAVSDSSSTTIQGTLASAPSTTFTIEFFADTVCNPAGFGEGERFLGSTTVTTDAGGNATFTFTVAIGVDPGQFIAATATDPGNDTSSFSACVQVMPLNVPVAGVAIAAVSVPTTVDVQSFSVPGDSYPVNGQSCELDEGHWSEVVGTLHPTEDCIYAAWPVRDTDPFTELGGFPCAAPL